ncbi:5,6-dimethylbenzimidazole synthase [Nocardioides sp. CFH 31398]|uniref:5,6-dimethylbenzimidazole synthase n=1 Tax=Nocardioides sp. CFH 31398 TaxID=2919579 RepID=UPI001F05BBF4|nr:5,6-dimethylbenzimidazole synthase [Nocardioides sp. CFH 31398]MCH1865538.1 5,6-dimethylbenzimidazole synthase [Nocardioides sp. CFH 31398]
MNVYEAIERRRDVRTEFTGEVVDDAVLTRVLGAAHRAPSVGMSQPWDFVVVRDPATLAAFADHVAQEREAYAAELPPERAERLAPITVEGVRRAGTGVVVTHDPDRGGPQVLGRRTVPGTGLASTYLAVQNLWLAATAEGLGVGWVSFYREERLRALVGAPARVQVVAWLCVGPVTSLAEVPDLERHHWRSRRPLADAVHTERWSDQHESEGA